MYYAAIGGMQLKRWTGYFSIVGPTIKVLMLAKRTPGCVKADMFKSGNVYFTTSIWTDLEKMQSFASSGLHSELRGTAMEKMSMFHNHTEEFETIPSREQSVECWTRVMNERGNRGSVGELRN